MPCWSRRNSATSTYTLATRLGAPLAQSGGPLPLNGRLAFAGVLALAETIVEPAEQAVEELHGTISILVAIVCIYYFSTHTIFCQYLHLC